MTQLLATLDGSAVSEEILPIVGPLALKLGARLTLLTVVPYPSGTRAANAGVSEVTVDSPGTAPLSEEVGVLMHPAEPIWTETEEQAIARATDEGREYLARAAEKALVQGVNVNFEVALEADPVKAIIESADRNQVEFIAMCTHGRSGMNRLIHGSVAASVINSSAVPVLLVHPKGKERN